MADDISKQLEEASKPLKPAFKEIVDSLAENNKEIALSAANFRNTSRDSFKGALAAQKVRDTLGKVADGLKTGEGQLGNIDFGEFKKVNDELNELEQKRADRLATAEKSTNVLGKLDKELSKLKEQEIQGAKDGTLQGAALNKLVEKREALESERAKKAGEITATFDKAIESEKEKRDEYQSELDKMLDGTLNDTASGLSDFSDGLKELTGFDLMDTFDSVVSKINGVGLLFGNQDLFGDVVGGLQNLASGLKSGIETVSAGIMSGLKATGTYFTGLGETFKEGGLSAVTEQLNGDLASVWNSMKEGAGNLMDGIKSGWSKGVEATRKGFMAFKAGAMNLLKGFGSFLASTATFLTGLVMAGASLVASGVAMLAGVLGISSFALVLGLVGLLLIGAAIYLYNNSEGFRNVIDTVVGYFMDIISAIGSIFGGFYDFFVGLFTGDFEQMFQGIKDIFGGLFDIILTPFRAIGDFFRSVFDIDIGKMLRGMAEKILPGWLVNRLFGEETSEPPMEKAPANVEAIQRGSQQALTSEEIDNLSTEEQVKLGYAKATMVSGEDGKEMVQFESTDKYMDVLRSEGVTSGGGFTGTATGSTAQDIMMADPTRAAELKAENQAAAEANRSATNQAVVTTINNAPTQMSNTTIKGGTTPTPRDTDPTGSRLSAVPA
jgi:hypothetical protein